MDNFSEKFNSRTRSVKTGKRSKPDKRWTILFIGKHGKTIALDRFKGMVLLTFLVLGISLATTAGLLYFNFTIRQENNKLISDYQELKAQIKSIRYEKDVLMTKLVLAESRSKTSPTAKAPDQVESASSQPNFVEIKKSKQPDRPERIPEKKPAERKDQPPAPETPAEPAASVTLEDFKITPRADEKLLRVQFKIKNTSPNSLRVTGHAIVVLKGEQLQQNKWMAMPRIKLSNGKPTGKQRGYTFGINYFKTMRFKTRLPISPEIYQTATVYIFSGGGKLILEQEFPVNLSASVPATAAQPASATPSAASKTDPQSGAAGPAVPNSDELLNTLKNSTNQ